jgi:hypothetical protein
MVYIVVIEKFFFSHFDEPQCFTACYFDVYPLIGAVELAGSSDDLFEFLGDSRPFAESIDYFAEECVSFFVLVRPEGFELVPALEGYEAIFVDFEHV